MMGERTKPIAERVFELADGREVLVSIDAPTKVSEPPFERWVCRWTVEWPEEVESGERSGRDSLAALLASVKVAGVVLRARKVVFDPDSARTADFDDLPWLPPKPPNVSVTVGAHAVPEPQDELVWTMFDNMTHGPLPPIEDPKAWFNRRVNWIAKRHVETVGRFSFGHLRAFLEAPQVTFYSADELAEQLGLAWAVACLEAAGTPPSLLLAYAPDPPKARGIRYSRTGYYRREDWVDVVPRALAAEELAALRLAWDAVTSRDPGALFGLNPADLPRCARSIPWLAGRYPDAATGLDHWESRLLRELLDKGETARALATTVVELSRKTPDGYGDSVAMDRMAAWADPALPNPLLIAHEVASSRLPAYELTAFGEAVLEGRENHALVNGIDRWVGGVHLTRENLIWRPNDWVGAHLTGSRG